MAKKIILLASGSGSLVRAVLEAKSQKKLDLEISAVISDRKAPVLDIAREYGIPRHLVNYADFKDRLAWDEALSRVVEEFNPDLVVSLGFMRILPATFVNRYRTINTHPALLPNFPGAHGVRDALLAGVTETGTTVHWVDAGVDTGKIIDQRKVAILKGDTEQSLHERIKIQERILIVETLRKFQQGEL
jgi:phosphoribosylglycinamide formyltransferase-1